VSLVDLWKDSPEQVRNKRIDQVIGFAGDGRRCDGSLGVEGRDTVRAACRTAHSPSAPAV
jgi:hypothetical protein